MHATADGKEYRLLGRTDDQKEALHAMLDAMLAGDLHAMQRDTRPDEPPPVTAVELLNLASITPRVVRNCEA